MTGDKQKFIELNPKDGDHITFGDSSKGTIKGIGKIYTSTTFLSDVYYVEGLMHDLHRISQLCDKGNKISFKKDKCLVKKENGKLVLEGHRNRNLYVANMVNIPSTSTIYLGAEIDESWLWHKRLGHIGIDSLNKLATKNLVRGLPDKKIEVFHPSGRRQLFKIDISRFPSPQE
ncbi:uncharacterized protein [Aristolochia californica]|uniref:uncharacterized protein n=1 Tax=Aristolochia californica TaxID=171875 RepID=UPI0035E08E4A